jgi:ssDNA-binding Zn-finger/Zn-ribbon topoisomerase 1
MSDQITLTCPTCGREMVERENSKTGSRFMGCTGYPEFCNETAKVPAYLEVKRAGGMELPGMETP